MIVYFNIMIKRVSIGYIFQVNLEWSHIPHRVDPLLSGYGGGGVRQKSCFKSAENRALSSLWVGDHRYTRILRASKLLWEYSVLKLQNFVLRTKTPFRKRLEALIYIKNYFDTIEYLPIEIHLKNFNNWDQNSYVRRTIWSSIKPYNENVCLFTIKQIS